MFTEKELAESIEELASLENEIKKLDALYDAASKNMPEKTNADNLSAEASAVVDKLMEEAKRKAEAEGRARAANYRDSHPTPLEEPKARVARRGLIV